MSLWTDLKKLHGRGGRETLRLLEAFVWLGVLRAALFLLPFRWLVRLLRLKPGARPVPEVPIDELYIAEIGRAITVAASRTPWRSSCLAQAFCGVRMLGKRGIPSTLVLGVGKGEPGKDPLKAHAWLCCGKLTVTGAKGREKFSLLATLSRRPNPGDPAG